MPYPHVNRKNRPVAKMTVSKENGGKFLEAYCNGCIKCKHGHVGKTKEDYEFEDRVRHSGLAVRQVNQTFDAFDCQNADGEVIVAKAQAILAAKNESNLILAGKPGTGKSHLASAIALEAMKNGHQAIFKSLPELLDEICFAYQNNNDPYGLMVKYKNVPCLVLDDWGKEKTTDARMDYLFQIIDYRYRNGLQTVLTTNAFNADGLKNRWNADKIEPLVSRILENGQWATIYASENHRLKKSPRRIIRSVMKLKRKFLKKLCLMSFLLLPLTSLKIFPNMRLLPSLPCLFRPRRRPKLR